MDAFVVDYFDPSVFQTIKDWPADIYADYVRLSEMVALHGPNLRMPYSRAMGDSLFELRARGASGHGRALYCFCFGQRVVILHAFRKKTRQTADHDLALARKRLKEIKRG
jgi:phage-related protein